MSLLTKPQTTEARIPLADIFELAEGIAISPAEIAKRWQVSADWAGRASVSIADAGEVLAETNSRYSADRNLRDRWNAFSGEVGQRRQQVTNEAANVAERAHRLETGGAIEHGRIVAQIRQDAARKAGEQFDKEQPQDMAEFARRSA